MRLSEILNKGGLIVDVGVSGFMPRPVLPFREGGSAVYLLTMDINDRLYVEIHPLESGQIPHPHPITEARFDVGCVYKVLGMYNPSETSECYFVLANPQRQIWFIPQRHVLAFGLLDSDEFFIPINKAVEMRRGGRRDFSQDDRDSVARQKPVETNGHHLNRRLDGVRTQDL